MSASSGLRLALAAGPRRTVRAPITAVITTVDDDGAYVTPLGSDPRDALGPCRGGRYRDNDGVLVPVAVGTSVLLVWTDDGPWIAAWEEIN